MENLLFSNENIYGICLLAAILLAFVLGAVYAYRKHRKLAVTREWIRMSTRKEKEDYVNGLISDTGFVYDGRKDLFYSEKSPWQKRFGYSRIYDEAAAPLGMIIDCEPIYFDYDGRRWMLELWKGQYGMSLGGEIGLYQAMEESGSFYRGVEEEDYIGMHMDLYVSGRRLFERNEKHWWLTGFVVGKSAGPSQLKMEVSLTFLDRQMCQKFIEGLRHAGYTGREYQVRGETVRFLFHIPHTHQPMTRGPLKDKIRLKWFAFLCRMYRSYTKDYKTTADKMIYLQTKAPLLFACALQIGKTLKLFKKDGEHENFFKGSKSL